MDWDFWKDNKDAITAILAVLGTLGAIGGVIWAGFKWGFLRWITKRIRPDLVKVFELITDSSTLLPKLYATENDNSPLADHNIKYQPRDPERDIQAELKAALNRSRYLLVTAPTGYGKTREAGMLTQTMMQEGWRVLRIRTGWLDMPKTLPEELGGNRSRVLIFLDDLNGLFATGNLTQSPRVESEKSLLLSQASYHDRLLQVLDMFEGMCTENEIRVIATARSESEQWKILEYSQSDRLWKRFERVELPEPLDSVIVNLLEDTAKQADIKGNEKDFEAIARRSDGTYRNILLNLRRWRSQNSDVNTEDFTETLNGSWHDIYERAVKKHPAVKYVYGAINILEQARIELFLFLVEPTATIVWGGNFLQRLLRKGKIGRAIRYLTEEIAILRQANEKLTLSDGQINVLSDYLEWKLFSDDLQKLIMKKSVQYNKKLITSLWEFGVSLAEVNKLEQAIKLWQRGTEILNISPFWYNQGVALNNLQRYNEAKTAYNKAINLNPQDTAAYNNLGLLLHEELKHYDEAEASYRKAIDLDPQDAVVYSNLGNLLSDVNLKRFEEAEAAYRKAIELDSQNAIAYNNLGVLLSDENLKRFKEAEAAYRKAIELNPSYANAFSNLGSILHENMKRFEEAETAYRKAIELNPGLHYPYVNLVRLLRFNFNKRLEETLPLLAKMIEIDPDNFDTYLAIASVNKELGNPIPPEHLEKANQFMPEDDWYNRACLENVRDNIDLAFEYLQKASQNEEFDQKWAWEDLDLQWIRNDPRFIEIVGSKPE